MNVFKVSAIVKVKITTMDLTKCALEIPLLLPLNSQNIHQGTIFEGRELRSVSENGRVEAPAAFPVQQVLHRLLNEDYCILGESEKTGLGRL